MQPLFDRSATHRFLIQQPVDITSSTIAEPSPVDYRDRHSKLPTDRHIMQSSEKSLHPCSQAIWCYLHRRALVKAAPDRQTHYAIIREKLESLLSGHMMCIYIGELSAREAPAQSRRHSARKAFQGSYNNNVTLQHHSRYQPILLWSYSGPALGSVEWLNLKMSREHRAPDDWSDPSSPPSPFSSQILTFSSLFPNRPIYASEEFEAAKEVLLPTKANRNASSASHWSYMEMAGQMSSDHCERCLSMLAQPLHRGFQRRS